MPLKHFTETLLVVLLGIAVIIAGVVSALLPAPSGAWMVWGIVFLLMLAYPVGLYPLLKRHRADYPFRALHFLPAAIVLISGILRFVSNRSSVALGVARFWEYGFSAFAVLVSFLLLAIFCLSVIRRRVPRLTFLLILLVPFLAAGLWTENGGNRGTVTAMLRSIRGSSASSSTASASSSARSYANLSVSANPDEEAWRQKLRDMEARSSMSASGVAASVSASSHASTSSVIASLPERPARLPSAGGGVETVAGFFIAGYCSILQKRAKRRVTGG